MKNKLSHIVYPSTSPMHACVSLEGCRVSKRVILSLCVHVLCLWVDPCFCVGEHECAHVFKSAHTYDCMLFLCSLFCFYVWLSERILHPLQTCL